MNRVEVFKRYMRNLIWITIFRVAILSVVIIPGLFYLISLESPSDTILMIGVFFGGLFFSLLLLYLANRGIDIKDILIGEIALDLLLASFIVYFTGGSTSDIAIIYLLPIAFAAYHFNLKGSLFTALIATLLLGFFTVGESRGFLEPFVTYKPMYLTDITLKFYLYALLLFTSAVLSGYLVEIYKKKEKILEKTEALLRRAQISVQTIVENMHSGLITLDEKGEIIYFNRTGKKILGVENLSGKITKAVISQLYPDFEKILNQVLENTPTKRATLKIRNVKGEEIEIGYSSTFIKDQEGNKLGTIVVFQDLRKVKELEKDRIRVDKLAAVGEFAANLAHEIRTPVTAIKGAVELLESELDNEQRQRVINLIKRESERLNRLVTDFLKFTKSPVPQWEKVELKGVIQEVIELFPFKEKGITVKLQLPPKPVFLNSDRYLLSQILTNLIGNAYDALLGSEGEQRLEVSVKLPGESYSILGNGRDTVENDFLLIEIKDTGPGITPENMEKIFEPFFTTKKEGSGMGLPIVKKLVNSLEGYLSVYSKPKEGTQVLLFFKMKE